VKLRCCIDGPKNWHHFVRLNFTKYRPIFKRISLSESGTNYCNNTITKDHFTFHKIV